MISRIMFPKDIPDTDKFDIHIHGERFLESSTLFPTKFICLGEHLVREGDVFFVAARKEADLNESGLVLARSLIASEVD